MRFLVLVVVLLGLAACEDTFAVKRPNQISQYMLKSATGYVSVPPDGRYGHTVYHGSGRTVADAVAAAFGKHLAKVEEADMPRTVDAALEKAKEADARYLIAPAILHWEDRATEFSGLSDRLVLEISVIEVATGDLIEQAVLSGTNGIPNIGSEKPEQLVATPVNRYVDSLFPQFAEKPERR
jgi:hypothetical protein